jgi:hypothetical protein
VKIYESKGTNQGFSTKLESKSYKLSMVSIYLSKINMPSKEKSKIQEHIQTINQKEDKKTQ